MFYRWVRSTGSIPTAIAQQIMKLT